MGVKLQRPGEPGHPGGNRRVYVRVNHQGHRKTRVFNSHKAAESYASQVEAYLKLGNVNAVFPEPATPESPPGLTVAEAATRWLAVDGAAWKGSTLDTYQNALEKHVLPTFGPRPVATITAADVEGWWAALRGHEFSRQHLSNIRGVLDGVFKRALASGLVTRNPVDAIRGRLAGTEQEARLADWLTEPELARFLAEAGAREPRYFPLLLTIASTGLRVGEALGLQVGDVDLQRGKLTVRRAVRKYHVRTPKSGKARTLDVPPSTVTVLRGWLDVIRAEAAVRGQEPVWLFPSATDNPLHHTRVHGALRRTLKAAGITRHIRIHDLRHTYASLAIQRGVPLLVVSRQLGHAGIAITADIYGHLAPEATRQAADAWEAILTAPGRNPGATPVQEPR